MSEPTVAYRLFHDLFIVSIQNKFLWSDQLVKRVPGMSSNSEEVNQMLLNESTTVARTPVALILLYDKGIIPEFQNRNDMYVVHDLITRHLNRWGELISNPISGRKPPPEADLLKMDAYADFISEDANFHRDTLAAAGYVTDKNDFISQLLRKFGGSQQHILSPIRQVTPIDVPNTIVPGNNIRDAWNNSVWGLISGNSRHTR